MTVDLVLVSAGALIGIVLAIAPQFALGIAKKNMEVFGREPLDAAALLVLLRIIGVGLASVFGAVSALLMLQS